MILVDANILIYAYNPDSEHHEPAKRWLEEKLSEPGPIRLAWATILAFLRITTNVHAFRTPFTTVEVTDIINNWFAQPCVDLLLPGERHWAILQNLIKDAQATGPLVTDAHLAALAVEHGATICTHDEDFSRFADLRLIDPCRAPA